MRYLIVVLVICALNSCAAPPRDQTATARANSQATSPSIVKLEELNWLQIDALDRARTLFILPVGMIEQHGPHLPVGADTLAVAYEADGVAREVSRAAPEWSIVMMPPIPYGHSGANRIGDRPVHPGTYDLRQSTFRALLADLGAQLAQNGFEWIFVLNGHGAPAHNVATNEACDFVSERFGVKMLHVTGLFRADPRIQTRGAQMNAAFFSAAQLESFGMDVHAGVGETSVLLAVRPDLVAPQYRTLPSQAGKTFAELRAIATSPSWQGYLSSPASATAEHGAAVEAWWIEGMTEIVLRAIRGEDMLSRPREPETIPLPVAPIVENALASAASFEAELQSWLAQRARR
jgi:creatinine amidohydrolase/Fe(II)-dependent formamide hydrolase-like protein